MQRFLYYGISLLEGTGCENEAADCTVNSIQILIINGIRIASWAAGILSVIFIIVGAIQYITSSGDPQATTKAKATITYAVIGLILSVTAVGLVSAFINLLT